MVTSTAENFERSLRQGFTVLGLRARHRKKAERMMVGDRVLVFAGGSDVFPATATIASAMFEDHTPIWVNGESRPDDFPWRLRIQPNIVLDRSEYIDASQIAPRLLYLKRWPPEQWPLAFQGQVHLLSAQDFRLIETEMERMLEQRRRRGHPRGRPAAPQMFQNRVPIQVEGPGRRV